MKQAVIAPSMLALLYPLKDPVEGYSREEFEAALVDECEKDIRQAFAAGAVRVSVDFTEGRLATREDPRNPWTGAGLLPHFIELINGVMARFSAEERKNIGIHTCPGGDRDSVHSADVPYNNLLGTMFDINAGYFLIQLRVRAGQATRCTRPSARTSARTPTAWRRWPTSASTVTQSPRVESAQEIADQLDPRGELHRQEPDRLDRRLRLLAVLDRREAQPRLARLRPRGGVRQDQVAGRGLAYGGGEAGHRPAAPGHGVEAHLMAPGSWLRFRPVGGRVLAAQARGRRRLGSRLVGDRLAEGFIGDRPVAR